MYTNRDNRVSNELFSIDLVSQDSKSTVKLTKFSALDDQSETKLEKSQLSANTANEILNDSTESKPKPSSQVSIVADPRREQFIVIWKRLSFQVDLSVYHRAVNFFNGGFRGTRQTQELEQQQHNNDNAINSRNDLVKSSKGFGELTNFYKKNEVSARRVIFENLNGFVKSGEISAILGPSGSGKTSLLNAICGKAENYSGEIQLIDGGSHDLRFSIIPQKDYLMKNLTVKENLLYSSKILNTNKQFDHETHILNIVRMLNLTDCFESSVSNISGGEHKRVSIAQELVKQPDLMILDEPTSGLDSLNCKNLIKSLAQLIDASKKGFINPIAIVMTIHQPDIEVFHMFDHVYCMAREGKVIYDGHPSAVMEVLNSQLKGASKYDTAIEGQNFTVNPATLLIEIASEDIYGQEVVEKLAKYQRTKFELEMSGKDYKNQLSHEQLHEQIVAILNLDKTSPKQCNCIDPNKSESSDTLSISISGNSSNEQQKQRESKIVRDKRLNAKKDNNGKFWYHTNILARRAFKSNIRDPLVTVISFLFHLMVPFVMWMVYSEEIGSSKACPIIQRDLDMVSMFSDKTIEKIVSSREEVTMSLECIIMLYLTSYSFSVCSISVDALAFPLNMHILLKEIRNGWYNLPSFVVAKTVANFPFEVLFPVMGLMLCYVLLDMPPSYLHWRFLLMGLVMALVSIISHSHGLVFGAIFMDSAEAAILLATALTLPFGLLSGFMSNIRHMPKLLQHLSWLSPYRYSFEALNIIRFGYGICPCDNTTIEYFKSVGSNFIDIPENMRSLFSYYLTSMTPTTPETTDSPLESTINVSYNDDVKNSILNGSLLLMPPGISSELTVSETEREHLISMIETGSFEPFQRLANLASKFFSHGRELTTCDQVRSEVLSNFGTLADEYLPHLILGMILLSIFYKILLFNLVKYSIGSRV